MMKSPDEIKKGLKCCALPDGPINKCVLCHYEACPGCESAMKRDALAYIQQLEARIGPLIAKAALFDEAVAAGERMKRERDALMADLAVVCGGKFRDICAVCGHYRPGETGEKKCELNGWVCNWEWRGVQCKNTAS